MGIWQTRPEIGQDELPRTVFDAVDTGLIVVDGDHRVIACNAWFTSAARIGAEEAIGRTIEELFPQTGTGRLTSAVAEALKYGTSSILTHSLHPALLPLKTSSRPRSYPRCDSWPGGPRARRPLSNTNFQRYRRGRARSRAPRTTKRPV